MTKPFSQACENNKKPILTILSEVFANTNHVLEIGSGTGQHAVYFSQHLPNITWQTSDLLINHPGINLWLDEVDNNNVRRPIEIDLANSTVISNTWKQLSAKQTIDALYTANTLHIISWSLVVKFFESISQNLSLNSHVCIYGPFNYQGNFTSESNANFDLWLKSRDVNSGIRNIEDILALAESAGLKLIEDHTMPANNRLLTFIKHS
ncbi:DUF938 domain-containing protein [Colwellia sp. E2M01]|uniref:DUF938 domain-containing protein n=1 Tax=Colwellia sp. E2M01 TaxID=2841561 RepID=UPI001C09D0CD|nr:DUF938 domain-containing protein [Colwellia sp. E2M01]MBU2870082.1 DUF938 domain-containing protein [Colwellia sp. E2M01]